MDDENEMDNDLKCMLSCAYDAQLKLPLELPSHITVFDNPCLFIRLKVIIPTCY